MNERRRVRGVDVDDGRRGIGAAPPALAPRAPGGPPAAPSSPPRDNELWTVYRYDIVHEI